MGSIFFSNKNEITSAIGKGKVNVDLYSTLS